ncbi:cytochrome c oxidase assembly protein [Mumia sp. zg.B21]|uniref:cytochrome c oxidase assembly protein n=1 Tax=Mumia sp. zg.B21 TaxID=2855447 RepID=UPI001C6F1BC0|nr:cytochrome c oxidase assembly protein [Mumia sp. zg.B21]MBW9209748.1 cytochrome c oxidase assembly protein [Mumia sp. zg.B21]
MSRLTAAAGPGVLAHGPSHDEGVGSRLLEIALTTGPLVVVTLLALAYVAAAVIERGRRGWSTVRTVAFVAGSVVLLLALSPAFDRYADDDFAGHAAQHILIAMLAPLLLVLAAPVTLLLRTLPHAGAVRVGRILRSRPVGVLTRPVVALVLSSGGLVLLYFTPLYDLSTRNGAVHGLVHLHMLLAGLLFAWVIAGPDPAPGRATVPVRLVVLGVAILVHAVVSQLLYAGLLVQVREPVAEMQAAGNLMYFGGDLVELMLALALLLTWRTKPARTHEGPETVRSRGPVAIS